MAKNFISNVACIALLFCIGPTASAQVDTYIRVNQIGFEPGALKIAVAFSNQPLPQKFIVKDEATNATVFAGEVVRVSGSW